VKVRSSTYGAAIVVSVIVLLMWSQYGDLLWAGMQRGSLPGNSIESFFPPEDPRATALLAAARQSLDEISGRNPGEPLAGGTAAVELGAERWFLSLYTPGLGVIQWGPGMTSVDGDIAQSVQTLWEQLPATHRLPEVAATARLKLDVIRGEERGFPYDGGFKGVALDKGLDGIVLRSSKGEEFYFLPSWGVEQESRRKRSKGGRYEYRSLARSRIHGRARKMAVERRGWTRAESREAEFAAFRTWSWVESGPGGGQAVALARANSDVGAPTPALLRTRIKMAADYLKRETAANGRLTYDYKAGWDKDAGGYNILRHAGTVYSMFQAYRLQPDPELLDAGRRAVNFYLSKMREDVDHRGEWFVVWKRRRAKLGGVGLGLCMLVEFEKASPGSVDPARLEGMARHIERMQNQDGSFESFFNYDDRKLSSRKSIYYSGEAILGLVRLHQLTGDQHWLDVAVRSADYLVNKRWVSLGLRIYIPPDAWLLQALEEMDRVSPDQRRAEYALAIGEVIAGIKLMDPQDTPPDLLGAGLSGLQRLPHAATAGSFGEALTAAARLEQRVRPGEERFRRFALYNAGFQLRNQFTAANSYYLPNPTRSFGGFRAFPDAAEIRNDHVQHNLSGFFGLLDLLDERAPDIGQQLSPERRVVLPSAGRGQ